MSIQLFLPTKAGEVERGDWAVREQWRPHSAFGSSRYSRVNLQTPHQSGSSQLCDASTKYTADASRVMFINDSSWSYCDSQPPLLLLRLPLNPLIHHTRTTRHLPSSLLYLSSQITRCNSRLRSLRFLQFHLISKPSSIPSSKRPSQSSSAHNVLRSQLPSP